SSVNDDDVLAATRYKQLSSLEKTEIASAQKRRVSKPDHLRLERLHCFCTATPIPVGNARTRDPDFPDLRRRTRHPRVGVNDDDPLVAQRLTTAHQRLRVLTLGVGGEHMVLFQGCAPHSVHDRWSGLQASRHDQGRFCQTIARIKGFPMESTGGEGGLEALES